MIAQGLCGLLVAMRREIVEDDHGAGRDLGDQYVADVCSEGRSVHCALDDPWSNQCILGQSRDQGLGPPASEGGIHRQPLAACGPTTQACEVRLHCSFINEHNTFG